MKRLMFLLSLVVLCNSGFAQTLEKYSITLGAGCGVEYGGIGSRISIALTNTNNIALVGGFGNYSGTPPLTGGYVTVRNQQNFEDDIDLTSKNLKGLGYSVGLEYAYYSEWARGGVHYISTGKFDGKKPLSGINWCIFGGNYHIHDLPVFIHYGVNLSFVFSKEIEGGMLFGLSLGLCYTFESAFGKKVQTKHLRN
jgi:hypothetical protein